MSVEEVFNNQTGGNINGILLEQLRHLSVPLGLLVMKNAVETNYEKIKNDKILSDKIYNELIKNVSVSDKSYKKYTRKVKKYNNKKTRKQK